MAKKTNDRSTTARLAATKGELADCEAEVKQLNGLLVESRKANEGLAADRLALLKSLAVAESDLRKEREACATMDLARVAAINLTATMENERGEAMDRADNFRGWLIVASIVAAIGWLVAALT